MRLRARPNPPPASSPPPSAGRRPRGGRVTDIVLPPPARPARGDRSVPSYPPRREELPARRRCTSRRVSRPSVLVVMKQCSDSLLRSPGEHRVELAQHRVDAGSRSPSSPIGPTDAAVPLDLLLDGDSTESSRPPPPVLGVTRLVSSSSTPLTPLSVLNDRGSLSRAKGHPQPLSCPFGGRQLCAKEPHKLKGPFRLQVRRPTLISPLPTPSNSTTDPLAALRSASSHDRRRAGDVRESRPAEKHPAPGWPG